jgi:nucleolar complex protein 3
MLSQPEIRSSNILKKLIMVSLCEIFKDICPSYKIRAWSSKENEQAVSKDVKQLKEYEETLLKQYKLYIDYLQETVRGSVKLALINEAEKRDAYVNLAFITLRCVTQLFEKLFYFNFSNDLIDIVVGNLTAKFPQLADLAAQSIRDAFKADKTLHLSLEVVL